VQKSIFYLFLVPDLHAKVYDLRAEVPDLHAKVYDLHAKVHNLHAETPSRPYCHKGFQASP
jgi:hypothetical protein